MVARKTRAGVRAKRLMKIPITKPYFGPEEREAVDRRIAELPSVREDDYFLLSTRLEGIEIAADALHGQMLEGGNADVQFDESDYAEEPLRLGS